MIWIILPKRKRFNDANIVSSLRQLLSTLNKSLLELDGKIDAKIKSLFNAAIKSTSNAISANGTRGVGKVVADIKNLFKVSIPNKIKQAIAKALDLVIKFFEWLESSAPEDEQKKYSKEAEEVFKQWKYKRKAIKACKQTGEGPEITAVNPHDDPTGAKAREIAKARAERKKPRVVSEKERKFAEKVRSPEYSANRKARLIKQAEKDEKQIKRELKKKANSPLAKEQELQLTYLKNYMGDKFSNKKKKLMYMKIIKI